MSDPTPREAEQLRQLRVLIAELAAGNRYYAPILAEAGLTAGLADLQTWRDRMPFTVKDDIVRDRDSEPPFGTNLTYPLGRYSRFCQSSGTTAGPLPSLDTTESWSVLLDGWDRVFEKSGVSPEKRIFFAFSFGPFLGFWTAFEAAARRGNLSIPGGGLSSEARLQMMARYGAQVLCCTPTYAIRLGEVLAEQPEETRDAIALETIIVAGEPGGSIPSTRARIQELWNGAQVRDHHGMTEVGPVTYESTDQPGDLMVMEDAFLAEVIDPKTGQNVPDGEEGELVLTTLRRIARPLLRYRTGDLVRKAPNVEGFCLDGGILGRADDMLVIRGVNLYPVTVERIIREFAEVAEFQAVETRRNAMAELEIRIEPHAEADISTLVNRIQVAMSNAFALRIPVRLVEPGSLPRFEFKSKRWVKE